MFFFIITHINQRKIHIQFLHNYTQTGDQLVMMKMMFLFILTKGQEEDEGHVCSHKETKNVKTEKEAG